MSGPPLDKPGRRPRYPGLNPRRFDQKYKELQPDRYAVEVAKVLEAGKTPAGSHRPIMVGEILKALQPKPGEVAVDATLGYAGHARELLAAVLPGGRLIGVDADPIELPRAQARLREMGVPPESITVRRMSFAGLGALLKAEAPEGADVILADLGLSSMQVDDPARGFSFKADGPLDMRINPTRGEPASALLSRLGVAGLARILAENADLPDAERVAAAILGAHAHRPLATTKALASVVRSAAARSQADDAIRRVFQAIRIAVNDEFAALDAFLKALPACLKPGGRVAILSFHSGEDRRVKNAFKLGLSEGAYCSISAEPIRSSAEERRANPRSTSAKLRHAVKA